MTSNSLYLKKVVFDKPVTIRFMDGQTLKIMITEKNSKNLGIFLISPETPLAKALIGQSPGTLVQYWVRDFRNKVMIIEIHD